MQRYVIYRFFNTITEKSYIGKTKNLKVRVRDHQKKTSSCIRLIRSIEKHGIEVFEISTLEECESFEEASKAESKFIKEYNSMVPNGYNLVMETEQGRDPSLETRAKMSQCSQAKRRGKNRFIGVRPIGDKFESRATHNKKTYSKLFDTGIEAAESYDKVVLHLFGREAKLNFEDSRLAYLSCNLKGFFQDFSSVKLRSSKYSGVAFHKQTGKWRAYIYINKKMKSLGLHASEELAYHARQKYITEN